ncbi:rhodanese-like domain-containing protein [Bacillaceae bacterium SIJ1]|uniref:rhodanese-like domain-containing protein n=1 Tax=Litoribacterium kuwaitense TaxID=1398745 RepID=UPI0013EDA030|nr:rhodanese-like domain-containing protein [Litoribacterium kuwaitense]NGP43587.1 rhodanese-like domain-containing protein [Litoribacterium kuwaitense]
MEALIVIGLILLALISYSVISRLLQRRYLKTLSEEEFKEGYRKAQLIDVRESQEFEGGHILGARNIPLSQIKMRQKEIRKDKPVYLYCQSGTRSMRAAAMLKKLGCEDINHLQGGFKKWSGRIKKNK